MEEQIQAKLNGKDPEKIKKLFLTDFNATQISGLTEKFTNLKDLCIFGVGLQTLKGFPNLPSLTHLDLSGNQITGGLEYLSNLDKLTHLVLSGNKLNDLASLEPLKKLSTLRHLVLESELTTDESNRSKIYDMFPSLKYLDDKDKEGNQASDDDDDDDDLDDDEEDEDHDSEETDEEEGEEYGLEYLQSSKAAQDEDEEDFVPAANGDEEDDDEDDDIDEEEEEPEEGAESGNGEVKSDAARGTKRKHEDETASK